MKLSKIMLNIASVICFVYGALYIFSLVFIPIGVYCFIAGRRFSYKAEHMENDMFMSNQNFKYYVIFASIVCFPLGVVSIVPYILLTSNNISISNSKDSIHLQKEDEEDNRVEIKTVEQEENQIDSNGNSEINEVEVQKDNELTEEEKQEKFKKLQSFYDKGIITEEELDLAREQLFGKK